MHGGENILDVPFAYVLTWVSLFCPPYRREDAMATQYRPNYQNAQQHRNERPPPTLQPSYQHRDAPQYRCERGSDADGVLGLGGHAERPKSNAQRRQVHFDGYSIVADAVRPSEKVVARGAVLTARRGVAALSACLADWDSLQDWPRCRGMWRSGCPEVPLIRKVEGGGNRIAQCGGT
jgi:hypothetical protein